MLQIRIQSTPNPNARKYVVSKDLKASGRVSYQTPEECEHVPMARELLEVSGVTQVHFFENVLTVTQSGTLDWPVLDQIVQEIITEHFDHHDENFQEKLGTQAKAAKPDLAPELQEIDRILDATIRPSLQLDGGDLELVALEDNILTIRYQGACGGCPSSYLGTLEAIRMTLRDEFRAGIEVVAI